MKFVLRSSVLVAMLLSVWVMAAPVRAQEKVENPTYTTWHQFKPGTAAKYKNINKISVMGNTVESESDLTMTLVEATDDKVVIEYGTLTKIIGQEFKAPATKQDFPRMIALKPGQKKEKVGKPDNVFEEGAETIKVAAGEFKTKWHKSKVEDRVLQSWVSDAVPGSLVKTVTTFGGQASGTNVLELVEVKKP